MYSGLIYVTGRYEQRAPSVMFGTIVTCGFTDSNGNGQWDGGEPHAEVDIEGAGDYSEFDYDQNILDRVEDQMSNYRFSRSMYIVKG